MWNSITTLDLIYHSPSKAVLKCYHGQTEQFFRCTLFDVVLICCISKHIHSTADFDANLAPPTKLHERQS